MDCVVSLCSIGLPCRVGVPQLASAVSEAGGLGLLLLLYPENILILGIGVSHQ